MNCKSKINQNKIDVEVFNSGEPKNVTLEVRDIDSNLKVVDYNFDIIDHQAVWNILNYNPYDFDFINGYKVLVINNETKEIECSDTIMLRPYTNTKFIDKDNILPYDISAVLNGNHLECFQLHSKDDYGLKNDKVVVDLGSSIGVFASYALKQNPDLKYICVEMNPNFHKICVDTFKDNPNVIPINAAIYKTSGEKVTFNSIRGDTYDLGNTVVDDLFINQNFKFETTTISLEDIIKTYEIDRINLLKVDIEGYEYELFENLNDDFLSKVDKIILEFHTVKDPWRRLNLINRLQILGYNMVNYTKGANFYHSPMFTLFFTK